jgi:alanyl-tRNA synthetase
MEALAGAAARAYLDEQDKRVTAAAALLKTAPAQLVERLESLMEERKRMEKELRDAKKALALGSGGGATATVEDVNGVKFSGRVLQGLAAQDLKPLALQTLKDMGSGVVALVSVSDDGKASIVTGVSPDLTHKFDAVTLVRVAAAAVGGKGGGGKPDMAQAGGPDGAQAEQALAAVKAALA